MSPTLRLDRRTLRIWTGALLLAVLTNGAACAQTGGDGQPFTVLGDGTMSVGGTPFRLWHRTRSYGEETAETAFGAHGVIPMDSALIYIDGQLRTGNTDRDISSNFGVGTRWLTNDLLTGNQQILGAGIWYDGEDTKLDHYFNQLGFNLERLGRRVDFRLNGNFPLENTKVSSTTIGTTPVFSGNFLAQQISRFGDTALRVVDFEVAPRLFDLNAWGYAGGYQMDGDNVSATGYKIGLRGYVYNDLVLDLGVSDDPQFGTNTAFQVIWTPGRTTPNVCAWIHELDDRMREQVYRNTYVAVKQQTLVENRSLTNSTGAAIRVVHVDSSAAAGGNGTFEHPLNNLNTIQGNSQQGDIVLAHANSVFNGQTATLQDSQRFLGEGNGIGAIDTHSVVTQQIGTINLPETKTGAGLGNLGAVPMINAGAGNTAVVLAGGTNSVSALAGIEVANLEITGGAQGIASPGGVGAVNVNRVNIHNTTGNGINLTPLNETLAAGGMQSRFNPTINNVQFASVGGDDIHIDGATTQTTNVENIVITNVTSTNGSGVGVDLANVKRNTTITGLNWNGGTTGKGAILLDQAASTAAVNVNGTNTFTGGQTGTPNTTGYGIRENNSAGTLTVAGTTMTNMGGDSVQFAGGSASMSFTGQINQNTNNASAVSVSGGHTGTLTFSQLASGGGVINATKGDGLQFDNADGAYTINNTATLNGQDAGIDVTNGSTGTFTFADTDITNPTGSAVTIVNSAPIFNYTAGTIAANSNTDTVEIQNNTGGSITFAAGSSITANPGRILLNSNTGTTTLFAGAVNLNSGVNDGVTITNNTNGSTQFNNLDIVTTSGTGFLATANTNHTVTVLNAGNTISTTSGVALDLDGVAVGTSNINFDRVSATAAASSGIVLNNLTGGAVVIGAPGANFGDGGVIAAAGSAVSITNAANVSLNHMDIQSSTNGAGVDFNVTTAASSRINLNANRISNTQLEGVSLDVSGAATAAEIRLVGNVISNTSADNGVQLTTAGAPTKTINLLVQANSITNDDATAAAAEFHAGNATNLNATVRGNTFTNTNAAPGKPFLMATDAGALNLRLSLNSDNTSPNNAVATSVNDYFLVEAAGTNFTVQNVAGVSLGGNGLNSGTIDYSPNLAAFSNDLGGIPTPPATP